MNRWVYFHLSVASMIIASQQSDSPATAIFALVSVLLAAMFAHTFPK